jgi:hypothetical protein
MGWKFLNKRVFSEELLFLLDECFDDCSTWQVVIMRDSFVKIRISLTKFSLLEYLWTKVMPLILALVFIHQILGTHQRRWVHWRFQEIRTVFLVLSWTSQCFFLNWVQSGISCQRILIATLASVSSEAWQQREQVVSNLWSCLHGCWLGIYRKILSLFHWGLIAFNLIFHGFVS